MTLFDECREALSADFNIVEGKAQQEAIDILNKYPLAKGSVTWSVIKHSDYESFDDLLSAHHIENDDVFVFADDADIPVFRSKLSLIAENIYDVTALSPKLFIFNNEVIIQPLFPTEIFRIGIKQC
ncbi:CDI toxin immunity protein [Serratia inhibens]